MIEQDFLENLELERFSGRREKISWSFPLETVNALRVISDETGRDVNTGF